MFMSFTLSKVPGNIFAIKCLLRQGKKFVEEISLESIQYGSCNSKITVWTITKTWEKSGLHPYDPDIFTDSDFVLSEVSSASAHLPSSYPTDDIEFPVQQLFA